MINLKGINPALKLLWQDKATIIAERTTESTNDNPFNDSEEYEVVKDKPCKLILKGLSPATDKDFYNNDSYDAKIIIDNDIEIPAGSKIEITDFKGKTTIYKQSSVGYSDYQSHQEIALNRDEKA
ncbi:hypothetical protein GSH19_05255 [Lactobacillus sp. S2-2]|uniref:hypothetical protein n=1 Tax=Lactobacillus sp. S2-2 TaxID=2692917 RepID=UPI001F1EE3AA|nr:hypothetical protein [Lactobacillus sp. S2-2]MCF6515560.1 hypothetical protein [Lactobacillus sp. S2-2]